MPRSLSTGRIERRAALFFAITVLFWAAMGASTSLADETEKSWAGLRTSLFGGRNIEDGAAVLSLSAPTCAEDPALVPVGIGIVAAPGEENPVKTLTLIVDENPAPVAA